MLDADGNIYTIKNINMENFTGGFETDMGKVLNSINMESVDFVSSHAEPPSVISQIKKITNGEPLKIEIFSDEIVFTLWETEIPIVFEIETGEIGLKPLYFAEWLGDSYMFDIGMLEDICLVVTAIENSLDEIRTWVD